MLFLCVCAGSCRCDTEHCRHRLASAYENRAFAQNHPEGYRGNMSLFGKLHAQYYWSGTEHMSCIRVQPLTSAIFRPSLLRRT